MIIIVFVLGLVVGSFLNAVIHRLHSGQSIFEAHSRCVNCAHELAPGDLIPVASFFILRGRCRYCGAKISRQYPLVEIATAVVFALIFVNQLSVINYELLVKIAFASFLIVIFVYDLKHYLILDKLVFPAAGLALIYQTFQGNLGNALLGAVFLAGFFWLLHFVSRGRWIGFGDVKLGLFLGLLIPFPETLALFFLAYMGGALFALCLMVLGKKKFSDRLPFGAFLTLAAFLAMLWGEGMIEWYFNLIGIG